MPIDAAIPLSVKPAQIESPLAAYSQVLGIKNQQQQQVEGAQKIQSNDLELKQQQRAVDYQNYFTQALQKHTVQNPDGTLVTDWGGMHNDLTNGGYGDKAVALDTSVAASKEAGLKLLHAQNQADLDKSQSVGRVLGAIPVVDQAAPPETQAVQKAAWNAAAPAAVASLVAQGHMTQQDGAAMLQQLQQAGGWTPQFAALIEQKKMEGLTTEQQVQHVQNGINAAREGTLATATAAHTAAETKKLNSDLFDKQRSDAAVLLSQAKSAADYDAKLATVYKAVAAKLPASKDLDFTAKGLADTQERILKSGMNVEQIQTARSKDRELQNAEDNSEVKLARTANDPAKTAAQRAFAQNALDTLNAGRIKVAASRAQAAMNAQFGFSGSGGTEAPAGTPKSALPALSTAHMSTVTGKPMIAIPDPTGKVHFVDTQQQADKLKNDFTAAGK